MAVVSADTKGRSGYFALAGLSTRSLANWNQRP